VSCFVYVIYALVFCIHMWKVQVYLATRGGAIEMDIGERQIPN